MASNFIQIIEKVAQLSAASDPVSGHAESVVWYKDRASIIAEMSKQQHPVYCTCYNLLSSM